jgi:Domain of unknown function (DUF1905)
VAPQTLPTYKVMGEVWRYPGPAGWHFIALPAELCDEIRARYAAAHRPFGSVAVRATLGSTTWSTSLFADTKSSSYLLPVKAAVRRREQIEDGDIATVTFEVDARRPAGRPER